MTTAGLLHETGSTGELDFLERDHLRPSVWCASFGKRVFDVFFAAILLLFALPVMLLAALAVLTSPGPIFFASERVGREGTPIRVLKFRTMHHRKELGVQLTCRGDERVTKAGRFLRRWKIDELPQVVNVVRGDMSLVGPRPDSADFLNTLPNGFRSALASLRPGITGAATLQYRNEEDLLERVPAENLTTFYVRTLLPRKASIELEYASRATMGTDIKLLLQTLIAIVR